MSPMNALYWGTEIMLRTGCSTRPVEKSLSARSMAGMSASRAMLRLLYTIAAVPKPGDSILYGDGLEDFGDGLFQDLGSASFGGAEQLLQLRPGLLDRIEIG